MKTGWREAVLRAANGFRLWRNESRFTTRAQCIASFAQVPAGERMQGTELERISSLCKPVGREAGRFLMQINKRTLGPAGTRGRLRQRVPAGPSKGSAQAMEATHLLCPARTGKHLPPGKKPRSARGGNHNRREAELRYELRALPRGYAVRSHSVRSYALSGHPYALVSLRAGIVVSALMVSRRVGPAQWRGAGCLAGGSIIGPSGQEGLK